MKFSKIHIVRSITAMLKKYCQEYYDRMYLCENQKWDLEYEVKKRDWEVLQTKLKINKNKIRITKNASTSLLNPTQSFCFRGISV